MMEEFLEELLPVDGEALAEYLIWIRLIRILGVAITACIFHQVGFPRKS